MKKLQLISKLAAVYLPPSLVFTTSSTFLKAAFSLSSSLTPLWVVILNVKGVTGRKRSSVYVIFGDDAVKDNLLGVSGKMWLGSKI